MRRAGIARGLAVAAFLTMAACGSGTSGGSGATTATSTGQRLSRAELVTKANAVCVEAAAKAPVGDVPSDFSDPDMVVYLGKVIPLFDQETKELQALTPAADVAHDWQEFLADQIAVGDTFHAIKAKLDAKNPDYHAEIDKFTKLIHTGSDAATKIGFTCGA